MQMMFIFHDVSGVEEGSRASRQNTADFLVSFVIVLPSEDGTVVGTLYDGTLEPEESVTPLAIEQRHINTEQTQ
jgi:hypothetical protein